VKRLWLWLPVIRLWQAPVGHAGPVWRCPFFGVDRKRVADGQNGADDLDRTLLLDRRVEILPKVFFQISNQLIKTLFGQRVAGLGCQSAGLIQTPLQL
jgi:hypothetical protein